MPLTRRALAPLFASLLFSGGAIAGPNDPSKFDGTRYAPQKALYDFNFARPLDAKPAFGYVKNHLRAIKEYGDPKSHIVIVAHGNELHAFSRLNRAAYPDMYEELKALADAGVTIRVCANAARSRGYKPDEFYDVITVVPAAVIDLAKWQNEGYSYMYAEWFPRLTREELVKQTPELQ
ncbi:DsrE family protein [Hydrogenophaga borbori]|jgi:intracellular sulfur oxidation DsrE/DsrF family protein|uniref:DsrE family protein n=1 Tax=Hydrogenophaga borbori TaxID=2294117 RepID=UPI00301DA07E